jgi:acetolactate synthase-1/2/3 large subunit
MNVAEYVFERLAAQGVRDVFMVSGGGIMHLTDALGRNPALKYWCNHHEQACAIAAEGYARVTGGIGVCLVTTGPGSTNALSGIAGAWVDSIPVVVISGQVRTDLIADYATHRQIGPQEIDIVSMAQHVAKYARTVMSADEVPEALERAIHLATSGRPGPVWLNIPLDVQCQPVGDADPRVPQGPGKSGDEGADLDAGVDAAVGMLAEARRPVIVAGYGIHLAGAESLFERFVDRVGCPVVTTIAGMDLLYEAHPLYLGRFGPTGLRRANFTVQNADLLLCIGASMSVASVGFDTRGFAPKARRIMVNIDGQEMGKPNFPVDCGVVADAGSFMTCCLERLDGTSTSVEQCWLGATAEWRRRFPLLTDDYLADESHVNTYVLANRVSQLMGPGDVILTGNALDAVSVFHSFEVKPRQRVLTNSNYGAMGWDLPAAIGACVAGGGARTVLITGDGSIQMNVQELLTIGHNRMNIKIFVLNNGGYESIRATQAAFCSGRLVGCEANSGIGNPDFGALSAAYAIEYRRLDVNDDLDLRLPEVLEAEGPYLCEVHVSSEQEKCPRIVSRRQEDGTIVSGALDDQYPFLTQEQKRDALACLEDDRR